MPNLGAMKCIEIKLWEVVGIGIIIALSQTMALWWRDGRITTAQVSRPVAAVTIATTTSHAAGKKSKPGASSAASYGRHTGFNPTHPWLP